MQSYGGVLKIVTGRHVCWSHTDNQELHAYRTLKWSPAIACLSLATHLTLFQGYGGGNAAPPYAEIAHHFQVLAPVHRTQVLTQSYLEMNVGAALSPPRDVCACHLSPIPIISSINAPDTQPQNHGQHFNLFQVTDITDFSCHSGWNDIWF